MYLSGKMFFLSKFCRICVRSDGVLRDINCCDYDSIKYSDKLKSCTKMDFDVNSWSAFICERCIKKLRISYEFNTMCHKSTSILQNYLSELLSKSKIKQEEHFENSELNVTVKKLSPHQIPRKQRNYVSKVLRCSLLKDLLTKIEDDKRQQREKKQEGQRKIEKSPIEGLMPLVNFTRYYNYGYKLDENKIENIKFDATPLDKLNDFVESYFRINFSSFHDSITNILEQMDEMLDDSECEKMLNTSCEEEPVKFEEVIIEPDINIKKEIFEDEIDYEYEISYPSVPYSSNNSQVKIEKVAIKVEPDISTISQSYLDLVESRRTASSSSMRRNSEMYPKLCESLGHGSQSSLNLLQEFTEKKFKRRREFSPNSYRCRTRNQPFISPQLKRQYLNQDFSCAVCNRKFKSQGYLQAHYSKMKHNPLAT